MKINALAVKVLMPLGLVFFVLPIVLAQEAPVALDFAYFKNEVQPIFLAKRKNNVRCIQCHTRSSGFRLQALQEGALFWSDEQSRFN